NALRHGFWSQAPASASQLPATQPSADGQAGHLLAQLAGSRPPQPPPTRFSAIRRYFFSFSTPITLDVPKSSPAASIVPEPQKGSHPPPWRGQKVFPPPGGHMVGRFRGRAVVAPFAPRRNWQQVEGGRAASFFGGLGHIRSNIRPARWHSAERPVRPTLRKVH